ncbi:spectrin beta chain, non-erythrocytic 5-like isoform X2 [Gigantopelta aegis]|uniref:spectrin beta chain, non-erythrocytic 5-like isoform X2 n=1 Tax=Gigantopelta aegis TaxID=1735272 RepID=UPI001B88DAEB|nr:spectrin beta chain, non-erythrocytic 5-like isoform X2 [Gigantopelta aegis]
MSLKETQNFEKSRIKYLQDERVYIQKKTFTKWANAFLEKARLEIKDLFTDLGDGKLLMKLLEIISGENLGKPNKGLLRVQKVENLNKCLKFLSTKVYFENIGAEDILDGNPRLILGLIWTIILRFQIQEITIHVDEEEENSEKKSAKDALLLWCQRKTAGYPGVDIKNFTTSWKNGLGFNALIHAHRPDLIDYDSLNPSEHVPNLNNAFDTARQQLGIAKILDAEDIDVNRPDEKSIITYVASYYHYFAKMKSEMTGGKRIAKILDKLSKLEKMQKDYESLTSNLLEWIRQKIITLNDRHLPNSLEGIQKELIEFKEYMTKEKPPKYRERGNIEVQYFNIQAQLKANGQKTYIPPEGQLIHDIETNWLHLEKAEHGREVALRDELIRQERLEQLARRFSGKAAIRESWLNDMEQIFEEKIWCKNAAQTEAAVKKHEAISAEILARKDRFHALNNLANELMQGNFHAKDQVKNRDQEIMIRWKKLLDQLDARKSTLSGFHDLMGMFREIESIREELKEVEGKLQVGDTGKHLQATEDYLQQHSLQETQLEALSKRVRQLNRRSKGNSQDTHHPDNKLVELNQELQKVQNLCDVRKKNLEIAKAYYQFMQDSEEEERWVAERINQAKSTATGKDLSAGLKLLKKHEAMEAEMHGRWPRCEQICAVGQDLVNGGHEARSEIGQRIKSLMDKWKRLPELAKTRRTLLEDALEAQQYYADADEAESWMREKMPLVCSDDYGKDEASSQALLTRHNRLVKDIKSFSTEIKRLEDLAVLMTKAASEHNISLEKFRPVENGEKSDEEEFIEELVDVPREIEVEEIRQREVPQDVVETRKIPQVKAMYSYKGQDLKVSKGEVLILLEQTNSDWWQVRKSDGTEGFVPANYVKEVDPKIIQKVIKRPVMVPERVIVKKTVMKKEVVRRKKDISAKVRRAPSVRSKANLHFDKDNVETRQRGITVLYNKLVKLAQSRKISLEDAIKLFSFYRECEEFEIWMKDKEQGLMSRESMADNMIAIRKKFENLLTSLAANKGRLDNINKLADDIMKSGSSQHREVKIRQKEINNRWDHLNKLKMQKEQSLEGASSIDMFKSTCDELAEWIRDKNNALSSDDLGNDLKGIQALQRKHANFERELVPMEEKMKRMKYLADSVRNGYPTEVGYVDQRQGELDKHWKALQDKANARKNQLKDAQNQQQFGDEAKDLLTWAGSLRARLMSAELPHDIQSAEQMLKEHDDLGTDIKAHKDKFDKLKALAHEILAKNPNAQDVKDKLKKLQDEENAINELYKQRQKQLQDAYNQQVFNKEADTIDAVTSSHEAFLDFNDLGSTVDDVESLLRRHVDFQGKLQAQEDKISGLNDLADKLISEKHPGSDNIDKRRKQVVSRRKKVKDKAAERNKALLESLAFQEFNRDAEELSDWMKEKEKTATDESYRDLSNLPAKLQKHQVFETELKSHNDVLQGLNKLGDRLIADKHYASPEIKEVKEKLNREWVDLNEKAADKGKKLHDASKQQMLNRALEDAQTKLDEMEKSVANQDIGSDLRGVKTLLKKHQTLENDLDILSETIQTIVAQGKEMASAGHFNSAGIIKAVDAFNTRFEKLKPAVASRKQKLQESLQMHQFVFDADNELQWIKEHVPSASSTDLGKNLVDAQKLHKKHQDHDRVVQGHQPNIEKVLATGDGLINEKHVASKTIKDKCQELQLSWDDLLKKVKLRKKNLDISLQTQKYLSEVAEVEAWINDKTLLASSTDYGKDENSADKMLAKNKVLETDIQTYSVIVASLGKESNRLFKLGSADPSLLKKAQDQLQDNLNALKRRAAERSRNLERSKRLHAYMRESEEFEEWITEQMQTANSEEYGLDFEHVQILKNKFDEFKRTVEAGSERYNRCERMAKTLLEDKGSHTIEVQLRQQELRDAWNTLLEQIEAREQKLTGAEEIHRFNKDVEDALSRIQEKYSSIPDDLGRDYNSTLMYLKKHEAFENELVALEAQLQVLVDDSGRLQETYPGDNAEQISQLQNAVVDQWGELQQRTEQRKEQLLAAAELHKFSAAVRDLLGWAKETEREMMAEKPVRDVQAADLLCKRHEEIRAEIEARDSSFETVIQTGTALIEADHYAKNEIKDKVQTVRDQRDKLIFMWKERKDFYEQIYDVQIFFRDAEQLNTMSSSQEVYLTGQDFGDNVEHIEALMRKHEAFEKVLEAQDEKLTSLCDHGKQLINDKHIEAEKVQKTMTAVKNRRAQVKDRSKVKKQQLSDALLYAQFKRDRIEVEGWIDDKLKIAYEDDFQDVTDLIDKMKKLQKHQAFEAEIVANTDRIKQIKEVGDLLIKKKHPAQKEIQQNTERLMNKWNELLQASANRGRGLGEARDILEFNEQADKVEMWMREKETLISQGDLGKDYEHCLELQKKVNDQESAGITVDEKRIKAINDLADRLVSQGRTDTQAVKKKREDMNHKWKNLQGDLNSYKGKLAAALELHAFNRDVDDFNDRVHEKSALLSVQDLGKDLAGVQALQRKQEDIERDMSALQNQLEKIETTAAKLVHKNRDMADSIDKKKQEAEDNWEKLEDLSDIRKTKLAESYQLQKFLSDARELITWSNEMISRMNSGDLAKDVTEAENFLQMHHERKAEIDGRKAHFSAVREHGMNLVNSKHYGMEEVQKTMKQLDTTRLTLNGAWDKRNRLLTQCHDLQVFKETAEQNETWLGTKEAFLANEDLGNTLYSVESLIKKHDGFEKTVKAQEERIDDLKQFAQDLCDQEHYAADEIRTCCQKVLTRCSKMWEVSHARRKKLEDSKNYQLFLRKIYEVSGWINEKLQVALDESYRDPTNLQAKLQKHQAFEAELIANRNRVDAVVLEGQGLLDEKHYASADIKKRLEEVELSWQALIAASAEKKDRLQDAYQGQLFNRVVDDLTEWMDDVENQLSSEDHGKDLTSVNSLVKKHQQLEQDIQNHQDKVQDVLDAAAVFRESKHFLNKELQARARAVSERYSSLSEPCKIRRENLEEALQMYQFFRDIEDELSWIQDKRPTAESTDLGSSLTAVQNLSKKHQALESEIVAHEPLIDSVANAAQQMIRNKHFASQDIQVRLDELHKQLQSLKMATSTRKIKLQDALEAQKFYTEAAEAESWMREKIPQLTSSDLGRDEDSVLALTKKLDALERDIDNFSNNIGELSALSRGLTDRDHYDSDNIKKKQAEIETQYSQLQDWTNQRRSKLTDSKKLFEFNHEVDEVINWITDKGIIAGSEDYGQDLEHVEILQQRFEDFHHDLTSNEDRVESVLAKADNMLSTNHFESEKIQQQANEIKQMWADLKEVAEARRDALAGAKEVHMYGRDADDTLEWIQEKDGIISSDDYGHDLESCQSLLSRHDGLERDLAAISEQVETITKEAERLIGLFPDAQEHIAAKHEEMVQSWNNLVEKSTKRKEKLQQAEQLQMYFNDYRELTAWISEMMAIITSDDLAKDLPAAEAMIVRYKEHKAEIDSRQEAFTKFKDTGQYLINNGHFLSEEIAEKIHNLHESRDGLERTLAHRRKLHEQNLEAQQLKHEMEQVEAWIHLREPLLKEKNYGQSIETVEELLRRHADFEKTVDAQEEKVQALRRLTEVEKAFADQHLLDQQILVQDEVRREKDRVDELRRKEQDRILETQRAERRREEDQRKAREVLLRRQNQGEDDEDERTEEKQLDKNVVKNLIVGRSQSIKMVARPDNQRDVRRAISFKQKGDQPLSPVTLQKAMEFKQAEHPANEEETSEQNVSEPEPEEETEAPCLPNAPPPLVMQQSEERVDDEHPLHSPTLTKKETLSMSPPISPKQKRFESVKDSEKKSKRTASFNIRRRTRSFKDKYKINTSDLPPSEMEGFLERKQELQTGGKKAAIRNWKNFFTVLFGQLLCFFKDREAHAESQAAAPPLNIHKAICEIATDYTKKKNVLRLRLHDGAEFLLEASSTEEMNEWLKKIVYYAEHEPMPTKWEFYHSSIDTEEGGDEGLEPSDQFTPYCGTDSPNREQSPAPTNRQEPRADHSMAEGASHQQQMPAVQQSQSHRVTEAGDMDHGMNNEQGHIRTDSGASHGSYQGVDHTRSASAISNPSSHSDDDVDAGFGSGGVHMSTEGRFETTEHGQFQDDDDDSPRYRQKPTEMGQPGTRPMSEPVSYGEETHSEKEKRKSHGVFGFLKKKKDKDHKEHKEHKEHKSHKEHKKDRV